MSPETWARMTPDQRRDLLISEFRRFKRLGGLWPPSFVQDWAKSQGQTAVSHAPSVAQMTEILELVDRGDLPELPAAPAPSGRAAAAPAADGVYVDGEDGLGLAELAQRDAEAAAVAAATPPATGQKGKKAGR